MSMRSVLVKALRRVQRGIGIVELMVAMLLGTLVVIGVVQIFTANRQTFRMQDAMALTQETGTYALDFIARDLLRAGYPGFPTADIAFDWANTVDSVGGGTNDSLAVVYTPQVSDNTYCTGEATGGVPRISNRYWVNNASQLVCQGAFDNGAGFTPVGTPQVLVDNVESFQVMFGVDLTHDAPVGVVGAACPQSPQGPNSYVTAALVGAAITKGDNPLLDCAKMSELQVVRTVRIGLLLRTPNDAGAIVPPGRTYTVLDRVVGAPAINPADGRLRRLFTKTVQLRNVEETIE